MTSTGKKRSNKHNAAFHVWCNEVSREMLARGIDMRLFIEKIRLTATPGTIKWLVQQMALNQIGKEHTSEMTSKELSDVSEDLIKALAMEGMIVPFPSVENTEEYMNSFVQ